jgi:aryl-alcohol dehydrogenase-like predicted oxidoreductase
MDIKGVLKYVSEMNISYVGWSPLAKGLLTEKYLDISKVGAGDRLFDEGELEENTDEVTMKKLNDLAALSHKWDMTLNQLSLSYMLTLRGMGPVIPSCSNVQQLESNAKAGKNELMGDQLIAIRKVL